MRESRWVGDYLHRVSKAIAHDCETIAFEDLTDVRDRMPTAKTFHAWAFRRLYEYVEYKTAEESICVEQVTPAYTSQRYSKCGTTLGETRDGEKHREPLSGGQTSPQGGAIRQLALNSGTLSATGYACLC